MSRSLRPLQAGDHVFLVDGSSFIFRAYFQSINMDRKYNVRSDGLPTGALRLFCTKLLQFVREGAAGLKPTHLAIVFDKSEGSHRKELYAEYKGHRPDAPEDLKTQMPLMREAVKAFGLLPVELERYEADDLIATYAIQTEAKGADALIVSSDKDLMQLVSPLVRFYDFESGSKGKAGYRPERNLDVAAVIEKWEGLPPDKIGDVLALMGDSSDNIPGVPGIGLKTAAQLIHEYGDLDNLLAQAHTIKQPKRRDTLITFADQARLSRQLVELDKNVPVPVPLDDLVLPELDPVRLVSFLKAMEFNTLTRRIAELYDVDVKEVEPDQAFVQMAHFYQAEKSCADVKPVNAEAITTDHQATPEQVVKRVKAEALKTPIDTSVYETVLSLDRLNEWAAQAFETGLVAFDTETNALDPMQADWVGFSMAVAPGKACYVPLLHRGGSDLFGGGLIAGQIPSEQAIKAIKPLLESESVLKIGQNIKYDVLLLMRYGIDLKAYDDTMLMSYVLDAGRGGIGVGHGMDQLAEQHLGHKTISFKEVAGSGKSAKTFDEIPLEQATPYAGEDADVTLRLWQVLKPRLVAEHRLTVYETLERPLVGVIARMEREGISVDRSILSRLSGEFAQSLARLEDEIQEMAGEKFSVGSPKQLGDILFGKMGLPGAKKTASGQWATGVNVLEELASEGHVLPAKVLEWRQLAKLKSTYTDTLQNSIHPQTKRIHTSFSLAATTTGRLSSSDPNLQNIPIRTEAGRKIRRAFIAEPGHKIISADYSQIELRLLAHIAEIPQLRQAFADGVDIHTATASEMFGVPIDNMDPNLRRQAKTINFGIIYGISSFGLAMRLNIKREEAGSFIKRYFERFPGIKDYMEETKVFCREHGYVQTLFGRICHYPGINSSNGSERTAVERQAINAPIQGTAADIIRRAMIHMEKALEEAKLSTRMLLQVHDELIFEAPDNEVERAIPLICKVMEQAPFPAVSLRVPLGVEARAAQNWDEAH